MTDTRTLRREVQDLLDAVARILADARAKLAEDEIADLAELEETVSRLHALVDEAPREAVADRIDAIAEAQASVQAFGDELTAWFGDVERRAKAIERLEAIRAYEEAKENT